MLARVPCRGASCYIRPGEECDRPRPVRYYVQGVPLEQHPPVYAECQGKNDPVCGRARFCALRCGGREARDDG